MARKRSQAQARLDMDAVTPDSVESVAVADLAEQLSSYAAAAIKTLGEAAASGDADAAKKVLDFLAAAARDDKGNRGLDVLRQIADIRRGG